jgi:DNA adenine methylase
MRSELTLKRFSDTTNRNARPFLKWAGGKQQLLEHLLPRVPDHFHKYIEPFVGGGALFYALNPKDAVISDSNPEIIHIYREVAQNVEGLIERLKQFSVDRDSYYRVRATDPATLSNLEKAARTVYLNKVCFNGLYRVNKAGQFNVPYGNHKNPRICQP